MIFVYDHLRHYDSFLSNMVIITMTHSQLIRALVVLQRTHPTEIILMEFRKISQNPISGDRHGTFYL